MGLALYAAQVTAQELFFCFAHKESTMLMYRVPVHVCVFVDVCLFVLIFCASVWTFCSFFIFNLVVVLDSLDITSARATIRCRGGPAGTQAIFYPVMEVSRPADLSN